MYKKIALITILFMLFFVGCEKKEKETNTKIQEYSVVYPDSQNEISLFLGTTYLIPLNMELNGKDIKFQVKESPLGSKTITKEDGSMKLEWDPDKTGTYKIVLSNLDDNYFQTILINVNE